MVKGFKILDYSGPTGPYVATGTAILPLNSTAGLLAATGAGMQAGIGDLEKAAALQQEINKAVLEAMKSTES